MIYSGLNIVVEKINEYLKSKYSNLGNYLELTNLLDQDGSLSTIETNKVVATIVNVERETAMGINFNMQRNSNNQHSQMNPPVYINMYVLFTSVFTGKNYPEGLKFISSIIEYLQASLVFNHSNTPQLNQNIEKLTFEMVNLDFQNLSQLWGTIGAKYMPSVLYKVRMLSFDKEFVKAELSSVSDPNTNMSQ